MKKWWLGILIGCLLSIPLTSYATDIVDIVGKKIQGTFPVSVDGVKLEVPAIVVDGTSYIPLKVAGQKFGYDVKFDSKKGISLVTIPADSALSAEELNAKIDLAKRNLSLMEWLLKEDPDNEKTQASIERFKAELAELESLKAKFEK